MKKFITLILLAALGGNISFSQIFQFDNPKLQGHMPTVKSTGAVSKLSTDQILKKPGHYTTGEWQALIDSFWGPGVSTATKLALFDNFWNKVDSCWGGFPNLYVNWDSLRDVYRPIVEAGVSRGRFAGILSRLTNALQEWHTGMYDYGIDSTLGKFHSGWKISEYPNYQSFHYLPGIPIINIRSIVHRTHFGAGLTLLPDSSIMIYSVMPNHPLGLQPGDLIPGYDGIPWKQLLDELLKDELPMLAGDNFGTNLGASSAASYHAAMMSVGLNWGLFDTIDVIKYPTNDTLHYPTSLLASITPPYHIATEQLPVAGISFPDIQRNKMVSWGIVEGTNIGYIYVWDWIGAPFGQTQIQFGQAVDELMHFDKVSGLILDFRTNPGGYPSFANDGFKHLFNIDPTYNYSHAIRITGNDHCAFKILPIQPWADARFIPTSELFDHPIAVLLGPNCGSSGDYNAFRLRFHPMARSFGKPTNGAYTSLTMDSPYELIGDYEVRIDNGTVYSNVNNEGYMIHKSFPVDEEVWLTRDGVAQGEDDVVKRALEWINNLSYAHSVTLNKTYFEPAVDTTIIISATIENPNQHPITITAALADSNNITLDSISLYDDGLHLDGEAGDNVWANSWTWTNESEQTVHVNVITDDPVGGELRNLSNAVQFTSIGPLVFEGINTYPEDQEVYPGKRLNFRFKVKNNGSTTTAPDVMSHVFPLDTCASISTVMDYKYGDIAAGTSVEGIKSAQQIIFNPNCGDCTARFTMEIFSKNWHFWSDTFSIDIHVQTGIPENEPDINGFALDQNYPNPFNLNTTISYQLPHQSHVILNVYDIQSREVATLVNGFEQPGNKSIMLNAESWPDGIYYYRLQAGDFVQTRKLILLR